jgi:hypothetical protein
MRNLYRGLVFLAFCLICARLGRAQAAAVTLDKTSLTFASTAVGAAGGTAQTITLTNSGGAPLTVNSVTVTGANSGDFAQTSACPSVAAGGTCKISVTFKPTAAGSRTAAVTITDSAAGSPHSVTLTGTATAATANTAAPVCKSTVSGAIAYTDLKSGKVSLPYGTPFAITGGTGDVKLAGGDLSALMTPQTVTGDYTTSDGAQGTIAASPVNGTTWNVNVGKLSPDTSVTINFHFTGSLGPSVVQPILDALVTDPGYLAAASLFIDSALGKSATVQAVAANSLAQSGSAFVTSTLGKKGLTPKNPDDLKTALGNAMLLNIQPIFNISQEIPSVMDFASQLAQGVGLSVSDFKALASSPSALGDKLKAFDYSKIASDQVVQSSAKTIVNQFVRTYNASVSALTDGLKGVLFTGTSSLAVGSDQATDVVCDLQKYAGFDVGALYSFRLSELRTFAMIHIYLGPVQMKVGATPSKSDPSKSDFWEGVRQRASLAFGMALKDISGSSNSKISGQNAFVYGLGIRLNKYFRITAGGLLY